MVVARPTRWGNPYPVEEHGQERPVELYRQLITQNRELAAAARRELAGRDRARWRPPGEPCHADVLLEIANGSDHD